MSKVYCEGCRWYGNYAWGDGNCLKTKRYDDIFVPADACSPAHTIKSFAKYTMWKVKNKNNDCQDFEEKMFWHDWF